MQKDTSYCNILNPFLRYRNHLDPPNVSTYISSKVMNISGKCNADFKKYEKLLVQYDFQFKYMEMAI